MQRQHCWKQHGHLPASLAPKERGTAVAKETCKVWIESVESRHDVDYAQAGFRNPTRYNYRAYVVAMDALEHRHYFSVEYDSIDYGGSSMAGMLRQFTEGAKYSALGYEVGKEIDVTGRFKLITSAGGNQYYKVTHVEYTKATDEQLQAAVNSFVSQVKI